MKKIQPNRKLKLQPETIVQLKAANLDELRQVVGGVQEVIGTGWPCDTQTTNR
jgi:hypothetical protein